ncbi:MAG: hypothetical protein KJ062_17030 [Thermoanaerobaculia bacterium]|nr:hypothetical protein [Thermoanaerobaculia bacterium]
MKPFKPALVIETPSPDPLEAAVEEAQAAVDQARRDAQASSEALAAAEAIREKAQASLDAARRRAREKESRRPLVERVTALAKEVAEVDAAIADACEWLRSAIETRERVAEKADLLVRRSAPGRGAIDLPEVPELRMPEFKPEGDRLRFASVTFPYAMGPTLNLP